MRCREVMTSPVVICSVADSACCAAARMRARKIGFIPVCDEDGRIVGTVTDRDLTLRVLGECFLATTGTGESLARAAPLRLVMTPGPITCSPDDDLEVAVQLMRRYHKARIVCVDEDRRPVGVISVPDIAMHVAAERVGALVRDIAEREVR